MSLAWYLAPYKLGTDPGRPRPFRYCGMDDFTPQIIGVDGGDWSESEILGDMALVKTRASDATLSTLAGEPGFFRLPKANLSDPLSGLSTPQKRAIKDRIASLGYSGAEIDAAFPNDLSTYTLGDVARFITRRRLKPRWDAVSQTIKVDSIVQACRPIADVDRAVSAQPPGQVQVALLAWTSFLSGLYFGTGFRPSRIAIEYFAREAVRLGLTIQEHSYDFLEWVATHSSSLLFRLFGAFPTTAVLDNFTGGDENPIATNWSGPVISGYGQFQRLSNQLAVPTAFTQHSSYYDIATYGPDTESYLTIATLPSGGGFPDLTSYFRLANPGSAGATDGYNIFNLFDSGATDTTKVNRLDNDVETTLGASIFEVDWASGDTVGSEIIGSTLQPYRKPSAGAWTAFTANRSDATYTAAGYIGFTSWPAPTTNGRYDAFGGGTVVSAAAAQPYQPWTQRAPMLAQ